MSRKSILIALVVCSFALTAVVAQATIIPIPIPNGGFDSEPAGSPPPNWTCSVWGSGFGVGSGNYAGSNYPSPYSGPYYAYLQATDYRGSGWCYQGLMLSGSPFEFTAAGDSITADLYQSMPFDSDSQIFSIVLKKGETWAAATQLAIGTFTDLPSPVGTWVPRTLTYVATTADLNVPLWLQLWSGPNGPTQVLADNVTVSYTPIPEPSTLALLAAGLVGLLCYAWRKRK